MVFRELRPNLPIGIVQQIAVLAPIGKAAVFRTAVYFVTDADDELTAVNPFKMGPGISKELMTVGTAEKTAVVYIAADGFDGIAVRMIRKEVEGRIRIRGALHVIFVFSEKRIFDNQIHD